MSEVKHNLIRVSIDGNICSGKTTCLELLKKFGYQTYTDTSFRTPKLQSGGCCDRNTLDYHLKLLESYSDPSKNNPKIVFYEGSPYALKSIYPVSIGETKIKTDTDLEYENFYQAHAWVPDVIIYLFCDPIVCLERYYSSYGTGQDGQGPTIFENLKRFHLRLEMIYDEINCPIKLYKINAQEPPTDLGFYLKEIITHLS